MIKLVNAPKGKQIRLNQIKCLFVILTNKYLSIGDNAMLDDLGELRAFTRTLALGSLSAAAQELGVSLDVVSKRLAALERRAGVRLIARTTRSLAPTGEGAELYQRGIRILADVEEAEDELRRGHKEPSGLLRVSAPVSLGRLHVSLVCAEMTRLYPSLSAELIVTDRYVDLIDERVDVAIRIGEPRDSTARIRKLVDNDRVLVATPGYVAANGNPGMPNDLLSHSCLTFGNGPMLWKLVGPGGEQADARVTGKMRSDSGDAAYQWALLGGGIILKSWVDVVEDVRAGRMVRVMQNWRSQPAPVCALYPSNRTPTAKVTRFIDAMARHLRTVVEKPADSSQD